MNLVKIILPNIFEIFNFYHKILLYGFTPSFLKGNKFKTKVR